MPDKYTTAAFVIGAKNFGDADRVLTFFTRDRGVIRAAAFGSRRPKSMLAGLQLFTEAEVTFTAGRNLDTVKNFSLIDGHGAMTADLKTMAYAAFTAELAGELFAENQPDEAAYLLLHDIFAAFSKGRNPKVTALIGAWQLLYAAGVGASLECCADCATRINADEGAFFSPRDGGILCKNCGDKRSRDLERIEKHGQNFLLTLRDFDWSTTGKLQIKREDLIPAQKRILNYLRQTLGKEPQALNFIRALGTVHQ